MRRRLEAQGQGMISLGLAQSGLARELNSQPRQLLNLHWVNWDMISIAEIGALQHPVIWTLHDMWPFCGAEHYTEGEDWKTGYANVGGVHRWVWRRKARNWRRPIRIVTPSRWLADCVRDSALMRDWPVRVIPNAIDTDFWKPIPRARARAMLDLPPDVPLVLFGAMGGSSDPRKGFEHLRQALMRLHARERIVQLLVFGGGEVGADLPFVIHQPGEVKDPELLRAIYAAADVFALPSRQDNLPNTGVEALACGTPIVGFDIGGMPDLVVTPDQGYLARPFEAEDLARGLSEVLDRQTTNLGDSGSQMAEAARAHALATYSAPRVAQQYRALYEEIWE
ncbi:glycosyltransferase [Sedimentitalea sp. XS_ASV28]|uniref:glycosyltransferase n=1 Tax=Sedimentitalea sp. XS_ASV28 TaxID=3241296 RepID=UPI0035111E40